MLNFFLVTEGAGTRGDIGDDLGAFVHPQIGAFERLAIFRDEFYVLDPAFLIPGSRDNVAGIFDVIHLTGWR